MDKDSVFFDNKSLSDVLEDIYKKSNNKDKKINLLLDDLKNLVKNVSDAVLVVPLIKEYLEMAIKNDEQLVKIATVMQRVIGTNIQSGEKNPWDLITDEDRAQIEKELKNTFDQKNKELQQKTTELIDKVKSSHEKN